MRRFREVDPRAPIPESMPIRVTYQGHEILKVPMKQHVPLDIFAPGIHVTIQMDWRGRFILSQTTDDVSPMQSDPSPKRPPRI